MQRCLRRLIVSLPPGFLFFVPIQVASRLVMSCVEDMHESLFALLRHGDTRHAEVVAMLRAAPELAAACDPTNLQPAVFVALGHQNCLKNAAALVEAGVPVNLPWRGTPPLVLAAQRLAAAAVASVVCGTDAVGSTAFAPAVVDELALVELLLRHGADPRSTSSDGLDAPGIFSKLPVAVATRVQQIVTAAQHWPPTLRAVLGVGAAPAAAAVPSADGWAAVVLHPYPPSRACTGDGTRHSGVVHLLATGRFTSVLSAVSCNPEDFSEVEGSWEGRGEGTWRVSRDALYVVLSGVQDTVSESRDLGSSSEAGVDFVMRFGLDDMTLQLQVLRRDTPPTDTEAQLATDLATRVGAAGHPT